MHRIIAEWSDATSKPTHDETIQSNAINFQLFRNAFDHLSSHAVPAFVASLRTTRISWNVSNFRMESSEKAPKHFQNLIRYLCAFHWCQWIAAHFGPHIIRKRCDLNDDDANTATATYTRKWNLSSGERIESGLVLVLSLLRVRARACFRSFLVGRPITITINNRQINRCGVKQ